MMPRTECVIDVDELREANGGSIMGWYAKGHHNKESFADAVSEQWSLNAWIPPAAVQKSWWRCIPSVDEWGYSCTSFHPAKPHTRGAFPVTYTEHLPLRGHNDGSPRCSCVWCSHGRGNNPRYREANNVLEKARWLRMWRAAQDDTWGFVWMTSDHTTSVFPCYYIDWESYGSCMSFLAASAERMGLFLPDSPTEGRD